MLHDRQPQVPETPDMMSTAGDGEPALGASKVGAELRAARLRLGWKLPDVATALRIRLPFLEAIEQGRVADLPGPAYAMGFLRSYATMLGLDAAEVTRRFRAEAHEVNRRPDLSFPAPVPERGVPAGAVVLLGVLIAAGSYAAWYKYSGDMRGAPPVIPAVPERLAPLASAPPSNPSPQVASILPGPLVPPAPSAAGTGVPTPPAPLPDRPMPMPPPAPAPVPPQPAAAARPAAPAPDTSGVVLRMKSSAWVKVEEKDGEVLLGRVMRAGETWPVPKRPHLLLTTGDAGGTEVLVDGKPTAALGGNRVLRRAIPLDADQLKPAAAAAAGSTGKADAQ